VVKFYLKFGKYKTKKRMSKIGKKAILIPNEVTVSRTNKHLHFKGKKGEFALVLLPYLDITLTEKDILIRPRSPHKQARTNWGTMASLIRSALIGVSEGFTKQLEIQGVGFRATREGDAIALNVGFSHPIKISPPEGITVTIEKNIITIAGYEKQKVGQFAAEIRSFKKPEPYKGKGIRYVGEVIRKKAGKKVAGVGAT
jgi:large subunit ribosomal protein L6